MKYCLILAGVIFSFYYSISVSSGSLLSSRISREASKAAVAGSRFVKIDSRFKGKMVPPLWEAQPYAKTIISQLPANNTLLQLSNENPDVERCGWEDFREHWHPFLYRNRAQVFTSGFPLPPLPQSLARRQLNINHYLDPSFVPKNFSIEEMEKWIKAYHEVAQKYQSGQLGLDVFFLDLLRRKVRAAYLHLSEGDQQSLEGAFPELRSQLDNIDLYSLEELSDYFAKIDRAVGKNPTRSYVFYPMPKGVPISLSFINGVLDSASIQYFPSVDAISLMHSLNQVPKISKNKSTFTVKGRLFLSTKALENLNAVRVNEGKRRWVDAYQAIIDSVVNSDEPNKNLEMKLDCIFDEIAFNQDERRGLKTPLDHRKIIAHEGLPVLDASKYMSSDWTRAGVVISHLSHNDFDTDFVNIVMEDGGEKEKFNLESAQYKFIPEIKSAVIDTIRFQVLENGSIISVVYAKSSKDTDSKHYRFVIGNVSEFRKKNIQVGDEVKVVIPKSGLSPYIYRSLANGAEISADYPSHCPQCNVKLEFQRKHGSMHAYCGAHLQCLDETVDDILRFTGPQGLHIPSLTKGIVEELKQKFKTFSPLDLISLAEGDFVALSSVDQQKFNQILSEIKNAKNTTLQKLLFALNISGVDVFVSEVLSRHFGTLKRILSASFDDFRQIEGISNKIAEKVYEYFNAKINRTKLYKLLDQGVIVAEPDPDFQRLCYKKDEHTRNDYLELVQKINECDSSHSLSDMEYDQLCDIAKKLEEKNPDWRVERSTITSESLPKVAVKDQFSLVKTYSMHEIEKLCSKHLAGSGYAVEPKVNGVACLLRYQNGKLIQGFTKSNKDSGHDITQHVLNSSNTPQILNNGFSGIIRGELYITRANLQAVNKFRQEVGEPPYVDGLSLVVGTLNTRQKAKLSTISLIEFYPYDYIPDEGVEAHFGIKMRSSLCKWFKNAGFKSGLLESQKLFDSMSDVKRYLHDVHAKKYDFGVDIDGLVIKSALDTNAKTSCAYKFDLETLKAKLTDVRFSLSATGKLIGVALIEPLTFQNGRTVSRVHVPNISQLVNLPKNSGVIVQYSSGSAPQFKGFRAPPKGANASDVFVVPNQCPACHSKLRESNSFRECTNPRCNKANMQALLKFAKTLRITSPVCSEKYVKALIESDLVKEYGDFFRVTPEDILSKTLLSLSEANTLIASVDNSLQTKIPDFMVGLGITSISAETYRKLLGERSWREMFTWTESDLVEYMARKKAETLIAFIQKNKEEIVFCLEKIELAHQSAKQMDQTPEEVRLEKAKRIRRWHKVIEDSAEHIRRANKEINSDLTQLLLRTRGSDKQSGSWGETVKGHLKETETLLKYLDRYGKKVGLYTQGSGHLAISRENISSTRNEKKMPTEAYIFQEDDDKSDEELADLYDDDIED